MLRWDRNGDVVINGERGNGILEHRFTANDDTFDNYTCTATIDDMSISQSVAVVGKCVSVFVCVCVCVTNHTNKL